MDAMRATADWPILASSTSLIDNAKIRHFFSPLRLNGPIGEHWGDKVEKKWCLRLPKVVNDEFYLLAAPMLGILADVTGVEALSQLLNIADPSRQMLLRLLGIAIREVEQCQLRLPITSGFQINHKDIINDK